MWSSFHAKVARQGMRRSMPLTGIPVLCSSPTTWSLVYEGNLLRTMAMAAATKGVA